MSEFFFKPSGTGSGGGGQGFTQFSYPLSVSQPTLEGVSFFQLNSQSYIAASAEYYLLREGGGDLAVEIGSLYAFWNMALGQWDLTRNIQGNSGATYDPGISMAMGTSGILEMSYADWPASGYTGYMEWRFLNLFIKPS